MIVIVAMSSLSFFFASVSMLHILSILFLMESESVKLRTLKEFRYMKFSQLRKGMCFN